MVSLCSIFFTKRINIDVKKNDGDYFSTEKTDHFIFENQAVKLSENHWYLIKLKLSMKEGHKAISTFSLDYGDGFNDEASFSFPIVSGMDESSIFFTKQSQQIKFVPLDSEGHFKVDTLQFIPINSFFAEKYMMNALLHQQKGLTAKDLKAKVSATATASNISFIHGLLLEYQKGSRS